MQKTAESAVVLCGQIPPGGLTAQEIANVFRVSRTAVRLVRLDAEKKIMHALESDPVVERVLRGVRR